MSAHYNTSTLLDNLSIVIRPHLELFTDSEDLMDEVLNADDVALAKLLLDDRVGGDGHALTVHLGETALVDQLERMLGGVSNNRW